MFYAKSKGFTLVEILVVVAIVGLLAALSIPNLVRSRINANEASSKRDLRTYSSAIENFHSAQNPPAYPPDLLTLSTTNPSYLDSAMAGGARLGYRYTYTWVNANQYTLSATPLVPNITGVSTFFVDETGVVRFNNAAGNPIE